MRRSREDGYLRKTFSRPLKWFLSSLMSQPPFIDALRVSPAILDAVAKVVSAELTYERLSDCGRKFGITGEVGEILVCKALRLALVKDPRSAGFDATDKQKHRIQIKTRRGEASDIPKESGRLSRFSGHDFDYALMGILNRKYELVEIWKAGVKELRPIIAKHKRSNPTIRQFKRIGRKVYP